jgi:hypothetical protein
MPLPRVGELVTLRDAGNFIAKQTCRSASTMRRNGKL